MEKFLIVIERAQGNYSAYSPDLPGCIATGKTLEEVRHHMQEAIAFHLKGLREDNTSVPKPQSVAEYVAVAV